MNMKNILIVILLVVGLSGMVLVEGYINPENKRQQQKYNFEQKEPLTNDFKNALKFKSRYIGNSSSFINLNYCLPLCDIGMTFHIIPDKLTGVVYYKSTAAGIDEGRLKRSLVYNSTANFVLIDNLKELELNFSGKDYMISRSDLEKWYGGKLNMLQDKDLWEVEVQDKLNDNKYVDRFISQNIK